MMSTWSARPNVSPRPHDRWSTDRGHFALVCWCCVGFCFRGSSVRWDGARNSSSDCGGSSSLLGRYAEEFEASRTCPLLTLSPAFSQLALTGIAARRIVAGRRDGRSLW